MTEDAFQESVRNLRNHVGQLDREGDPRLCPRYIEKQEGGFSDVGAV